MATIPIEPAWQIRLVSFRLAAKGSTEARRLFLDREGQVCAEPHWLPREQALLLARNQQLIWGSAARVIVHLRARGPASVSSLAQPLLAFGHWALQRLQPRKQKALLVHALDRNGRSGLHLIVRVLSQDDIHGMGLI